MQDTLWEHVGRKCSPRKERGREEMKWEKEREEEGNRMEEPKPRVGSRP